MYGNGQFGIPGQTDANFASLVDLLWGGDESRVEVLRTSSYAIDSTARDAANTPTTVLRAGLLMGVDASNGVIMQYNPAATDGSQYIHGILPVELSMVDGLGIAVDRYAPMIVRAPVKASRLLILGAALVGHADEYNARRQLRNAGFILDDDPQGHKAGAFRMEAKTENYTVVAGDNGKMFTTLGAAGAVNFTLPTLARGLEFEFFNEVDQNMVITAAAGTLVVHNNAAATSIAFSTSSEKIGGKVKIRANTAGTKWLAEVALGADSQTVTIA